LLAVWLLHTFDSTLPIALYIAAGAVCGFIATALLPEPGRREVEKEFDTSIQEAIPETAKQSGGRVAVTT
jgi:hypothetical protein